MSDLPDTITVKAAEPKKPEWKERVILWERDEAHPEGEIYIAYGDGIEHEVAPTPGIMEKVREGALTRVGRVTKAERALLEGEDTGETSNRPTPTKTTATDAPAGPKK